MICVFPWAVTFEHTSGRNTSFFDQFVGMSTNPKSKERCFSALSSQLFSSASFDLPFRKATLSTPNATPVAPRYQKATIAQSDLCGFTKLARGTRRK